MKSKPRTRAWIAASTCAGACTLLATAASAQPPGGEIVRQDFENGDAGWTVFAQPEGAGAQPIIEREPGQAHSGTGALKFSYTLKPGNIAALALGNPAPLAMSNTIEFWAKAATESTMAFAIKEVGGATWVALFNLPEGKWQRVELHAGDFSTGIAPGEAPDADGKLSLEKIEWAGIGDFSQFMLQQPNPAVQQLFGIEPGPRTMWLDDVTFDPSKTPAPAADKSLVVDDFSAPHTSWIHLAGTDVARTEGSVGGAKVPGLEVTYTQGGGKMGGVVRRVNAAGWDGATKLSLRLASQIPATLALQLEETGGGKYFVPLPVAGDGEPTLHSFSLSQFLPADDSKDANGKLDVDKVEQIILLDLASLNPAAPRAENTLWLTNIALAK
jgi:hypothetical protein